MDFPIPHQKGIQTVKLQPGVEECWGWRATQGLNNIDHYDTYTCFKIKILQVFPF